MPHLKRPVTLKSHSDRTQIALRSHSDLYVHVHVRVRVHVARARACKGMLQARDTNMSAVTAVVGMTPASRAFSNSSCRKLERDQRQSGAAKGSRKPLEAATSSQKQS